MAALKTIGNLLKGSGWVKAMVQAEGLLLQELQTPFFVQHMPYVTGEHIR